MVAKFDLNDDQVVVMTAHSLVAHPEELTLVRAARVGAAHGDERRHPGGRGMGA